MSNIINNAGVKQNAHSSAPSNLVPNKLVAHHIPLAGKHLIEASAGTGKTFNITRIYLRLLLEKNLSVEQILVMTFTKDATEELRGRIDSFIRDSLANWSSLITQDEYFIAIAKKVTTAQAQQRLRQALLFLDEAAIFTIHGFCKRVLNQHAFDSGLPFTTQMESNCQDLLVESCQDYYRILATQRPEAFLQLIKFWSHPQSFLKHFAGAVHKRGNIHVVSTTAIKQHLIETAKRAVASLTSQHDFLSQHLIEKKKGAEREGRAQELVDLIQWLSQLAELVEQHLTIESFEIDNTQMPDSFADARRYARSTEKDALNEIFADVKKIKLQLKSINERLNKAIAFSIVREGINDIRQRFNEKKQQKNILSFDDLISTLASKLSHSSVLAQKVFQQFPVALVDEFQDTDPDQFSILSSVYSTQTNAAVYMIGDPKQAIYGFRGGDVFAYLAAREDCDSQWIMDTNWRSSPEMITAYNRLFFGEALDQKAQDVFGYGIPYLPVNAAPNAQEKSKTYNNSQQGLHFIHFSSSDPRYVGHSKKSGANKEGAIKVKQSFREVMASWCAQEIVTLLAQQENQLASQDIAILVRDSTEATAIKQALVERGLACVFMSNRANLLKSEQSQQLINILRGILYVENERLYTAALSSALLSYGPDALAQLQVNEGAWQQQRNAFIALRDLWLSKGFITMALSLLHEHFLIAHEEKDRILTNILHLFEVLQAASQQYRQPQELLHWFEQQINADNPELEAELRLESDDNLIRIITQHGSKGLEYPVVFIPFATRHKDPLKLGNTRHMVVEHHDENKRLQVSLEGTHDAQQTMAAEAYAETIRLLYVAVTRAEQRCYIFTTEFEQWQQSPLGKTLKSNADDDLLKQLKVMASQYPEAISVSEVDELFEQQNYPQHTMSVDAPQVERFTGKIERDWWLSSFSSLSRNLRSQGVSVPDRDENAAQHNELLLGAALHSNDTDELVVNALRFELVKGAHSGNLLHNILEHCDFSAPDWPALIEKPLKYYGELPDTFDEIDLHNWLEQVVHAPLSSASSSEASQENGTPWALSDIENRKTLREVEFYYPMHNSKVNQLTELLTEHRAALPYVHNAQPFAHQRVILPSYQKLKGMMHGFIDLIFEHDGQFFISDHKSTHLGDHYSHYHHTAMRECIEHEYYDLQYLIYSLALHRYLTLVLPDYDAKIHFGGVYYFFLRGMTNLPEHQGAGVYFRKISAQELTKLDELFSEHEQTSSRSASLTTPKDC